LSVDVGYKGHQIWIMHVIHKIDAANLWYHLTKFSKLRSRLCLSIRHGCGLSLKLAGRTKIWHPVEEPDCRGQVFLATQFVFKAFLPHVSDPYAGFMVRASHRRWQRGAVFSDPDHAIGPFVSRWTILISLCYCSTPFAPQLCYCLTFCPAAE
jgi:hypothetical protein